MHPNPECMQGDNCLTKWGSMTVPTPLRTTCRTVNFKLEFDPSSMIVRYYSVDAMKSRLNVTQVGRMLYFLGDGKMLIGITSDRSMQFCVISRQSQSTAHVYEQLILSMKISHGVDLIEEKLGASCDCLERAILFSLKCELVRGGGWMNIGKGMELFTTSDILNKPALEGTRNVHVVKVSQGRSMSVDVEFAVYKYYPINSSLAKQGIEGSRVYVLPNLVEAVVGEPICEVTDGSVAFLKGYWLANHGVTIPGECLHDQVRITFPGSSMQLTYPLVCVWRFMWSFLPNQTVDCQQTISSTFESALAKIVGTWKKYVIPDLKIGRPCDFKNEVTSSKRNKQA